MIFFFPNNYCSQSFTLISYSLLLLVLVDFGFGNVDKKEFAILIVLLFVLLFFV